jgi:hypothetical protein
MMRTWKKIGLSALMAALLTAGPARAETSGPRTDSEKLDDIQKQLDELRKSVGDVKRSVAALSTIERDLKDLRAEANAGTQNALSQINDLKDEVARLKREVDGLRNRPPATGRIAASPPETPVTTGRVELLNTYGADVTIAVNRVTYHLRPQERMLTTPIPTGTFTYEVLGITPQRVRTLVANEPFTIHVHPQP